MKCAVLLFPGKREAGLCQQHILTSACWPQWTLGVLTSNTPPQGAHISSRSPRIVHGFPPFHQLELQLAPQARQVGNQRFSPDHEALVSLGGHPAWVFSSFNTVHQPILKSAERKASWEGDNTEHVFVISHATIWMTSLQSVSSAPLNLPHSYSRDVQQNPMKN